MRLLLVAALAAAVHVPNGYRVVTWATGLQHPTALSFGSDQRLDVSEDVGISGRRHTIVSRLPFGLHQQDAIVSGPDGRLYLGSGSTCDSCTESDRRTGPSGACWSPLGPRHDLRDQEAMT